jgi:two-component system sensor histidine kinase CiaH
MKPFLRQFEAWATGSRHNQFLHARVKLTLFYTAIFSVFIVAFSLALYLSFSQRLRLDLDKDNVTEQNQRLAIFDSIDHLQGSIKWLDLGTIFIVAALSYYVAGKSLEPIRKSILARERFMADASHELRTPLTVLQTGLEVFDRKKMPTIDEARRLSRSSLEEVRRMDRLVTDLRTLARLDSSQLQSSVEPFDLSVALKRSADSLGGYAEQHGIKIMVTSSTPTWVKADPYELEQVCSNLIKNAIDYSPQGQMVNAAVKKDRCAILCISDSGTGISSKDLPHVFERFWRAEHSRSRKTGGSGLGLSIVKDLVERMGGSVSVKSALNNGSEFTVSLPLSESP